MKHLISLSINVKLPIHNFYLFNPFVIPQTGIKLDNKNELITIT